MVVNKSIIILSIFLLLGFMIRLWRNKKESKKPLMEINEFFEVLFTTTLFASGIIAIFISIFNYIPFGEDFIISRPIIDFIAGVILMYYSSVQLWKGNSK